MEVKKVHPDEIAEMLKGKTIAALNIGHYLHWDMTIKSITMTDGSTVNLAGNADYARIESVKVGETLYEPDRGDQRSQDSGA